MPNRELLEQEALNLYLEKIPEWKLVDHTIIREFVCSNFTSAIGLVNSIAIYSESMDHHPDIQIYGWNKVKILLTTHDRGGLTELDFDLAQKIDTIKIDIN